MAAQFAASRLMFPLLFFSQLTDCFHFHGVEELGHCLLFASEFWWIAHYFNTRGAKLPLMLTSDLRIEQIALSISDKWV